jgi:hypothetical protein
MKTFASIYQQLTHLFAYSINVVYFKTGFEALYKMVRKYRNGPPLLHTELVLEITICLSGGATGSSVWLRAMENLPCYPQAKHYLR